MTYWATPGRRLPARPIGCGFYMQASPLDSQDGRKGGLHRAVHLRAWNVGYQEHMTQTHSNTFGQLGSTTQMLKRGKRTGSTPALFGNKQGLF